MTETYRIAPLPWPPRTVPCGDGCTSTADLIRCTEYKGIQCVAYQHGGSVLGHRWSDERYYDCARCGLMRGEHVFVSSPDHGELLLCPAYVGAAAYVVGSIVDPTSLSQTDGVYHKPQKP